MPPTTTAAHVNRITALIDKAESTTYPAEAEALMAKAQELMARHAIDEAMLVCGAEVPDDIVDRMVTVRAPYARAKTSLLGAVARANRCRVLIRESSQGNQYCVVVGHRTDLEHTTTMFQALSWQAVRFMLDEPVPPGDTARRFRHAFLLAYAGRIGQRLRAVVQDAEDVAGGPMFDGQPSAVSLVLLERQEAVDARFHAMFPNLASRRRVSVSSSAGYRQGQAAADRAALGGRAVGGHLRALPGGGAGPAPARGPRSAWPLGPVR
jgi:hypothetical protein